MPTQLNPQEVYLLERYTSPSYFCELRDAWHEMVKHVESCLTAFMRNLPKDYRTKPLPEQPDIVWGERVLPNFHDTLQGLNTGYILLTHGDVKGLTYAHGPRNDFKGQMDYWAGWMSKADEDLYNELLSKAVAMAINIVTSEGAYWKPLSLSNLSPERGPLNAPEQWPAYQINKNVAVRTGEKTPIVGIYLPDIDNSCAEFLSTNHELAPSASVHIGYQDLLHPITGEKYGQQPVFEKRNCVWYLIEHGVEKSDRPEHDLAPDVLQHGRIAAGETCVQSGFYFTPASSGSRRLFQKGEIMPTFDSSYGATIWQWDNNQE